MFKMLEKLMYAGVGALALTEEKAREIVKELEEKGHVTSEEGAKMVRELVEKGKKASEDLKKTVSEEVNKMAQKMTFVRKEDFDKLAKEVHDLNVKMDILLSHEHKH